MAETISPLSPKARLNAICPYFTMFPLSFPYHVIGASSQTAVVLDPFCGRGTTLYASRLLGRKAYGIDSSPVAVAVSAAKLAHATPEAVLGELESALSGPAAPETPRGSFWASAYHKSTLEEICRVRSFLMADCSTPSRVLLRALLLGALHGPLPKKLENAGYLSNQMPRTFASKPSYSERFWRARNLTPPRLQVRSVVARRAHRFLREAPPAPEGIVVPGDSRSATSYGGLSGVTTVITSPPYYGLNTYVTDQWIRNWFLGGPEAPDRQLDKQFSHQSPEAFAADLREVWRNCASVSQPGARLVVRFGSISCRSAVHHETILGSFDGTRWVLQSVLPAGSAQHGHRQATQMRVKTAPREEIDLELKLDA